MFLATHPDLPVSTLREFIDYVKARPGEINYGSSGVGSIHHLSMEALKAPLQLKMTHIPYRGTGQSARRCWAVTSRCCSRPIRHWRARPKARRSNYWHRTERAAGSKRRTCPRSQRWYRISIWRPSSGSSRAPGTAGSRRQDHRGGNRGCQFTGGGEATPRGRHHASKLQLWSLNRLFPVRPSLLMGGLAPILPWGRCQL